MGFLFWRKTSAPEFRTHSLPGNVGTVSLPSTFDVEMENESTLLANPKGENSINLRFSSISFTKKDSEEPSAKPFLRKKASESGLTLDETTDRCMLRYRKRSNESGVPLVVLFWEVGEKNTVAIVSASILESRRQSKGVRAVLDVMPRIVNSLTISKTYKVVEIDGKTIEGMVTTTDPLPEQLRPFESEELNWLRANLASAAQLSIKYGSGGELTPEGMDGVFSRWMFDEEEKEDDVTVANALGAAFGEYFVEHLGFRWIVLTNQFGTDYAVRHHLGETTAYPRASVQKRIDTRETSFFHSIYLMLVQRLKEWGADSAGLIS
jgi:hypothetical protein